MVGEELSFGDVAYGFACLKSESEEAAHNASEDGDGNAFAKVVIRFSGFGFLFWRDLAVLGETGGAIDGYGDHAHEDTEEDDLAGGFVQDGVNGAIVDGWYQGAERSAEAKSDGVAESDAEITDGEAEGEAAHAPERSPEKCVADGMARGVGMDLAEDAEDVGNEDRSKYDRGDDPCCEALDKPVDLPGPALDAAERDKVCGGGETADPVKDNADKRVGSHDTSFRDSHWLPSAYYRT